MSCANPALLCEVVIDDTNKFLDVNYDGGGESNLTLTTGTYANMVDLIAEVETQLDTVNASFNAFIQSAGKVRIEHPTKTFVLLWKTGVHGSDNTDTHCGTLLGWDDSADTSAASSIPATNQHMYGWYPEKPPREDTDDRPWIRGAPTFVAVSGEASRCTWAVHTKRRLDFLNIPDDKFLDADSAANESFEEFFEVAFRGTPFSIFQISGTDNSDSWTDEGEWVVIEDGDSDMTQGYPRFSPGAAYYSFAFDAVKQP